MSAYKQILAGALRSSIKALVTVAHGRFEEEPKTSIVVDFRHPDLVANQYLKDKLEDLVHLHVDGWNEGFHASNTGYTVTYNMFNTREEVYIPYDAILAFLDKGDGVMLDFVGGHIVQEPSGVEERPQLQEVSSDASSSADKVVGLAAYKKARGKPLTKLESEYLQGVGEVPPQPA